MIDLEKLRELAQDANTAEQWYAAHDMTSCSYDYDKAFIAASSPEVVLELLDHISQLEKDAGRYRYLTQQFGDYCITDAMECNSGVYKAGAADSVIDTAMEAKHG